MSEPRSIVFRGRGPAGFTRTDLMVILAVVSVLAAVGIGALHRSRSNAGLARCLDNLRRVDRAVLQCAGEHNGVLPLLEESPAPGGWWWYKELVKGYLSLPRTSSTNDLVFACPQDRGYGDGPGRPQPFCRSARHDFTSYVYNGVDLPGVPHVAGRPVDSLRTPVRTLVVMEWTAHAPLSWHRSRTGRANTPFYKDAQSAVAFADGHAAFVRIYYDGMNAAYTRDPVPGYDYQYSGD